jgi:excisionase family DNA binding protein
MSPLPTDLIGDEEARALLGNLPSATLRSLRHRRQVPFYRLSGRLVRYSRAELLAWLEQRHVPAAPPDELAAAREALRARRGRA